MEKWQESACYNIFLFTNMFRSDDIDALCSHCARVTYTDLRHRYGGYECVYEREVENGNERWCRKCVQRKQRTFSIFVSSHNPPHFIRPSRVLRHRQLSTQYCLCTVCTQIQHVIHMMPLIRCSRYAHPDPRNTTLIPDYILRHDFPLWKGKTERKNATTKKTVCFPFRQISWLMFYRCAGRRQTNIYSRFFFLLRIKEYIVCYDFLRLLLGYYSWWSKNGLCVGFSMNEMKWRFRFFFCLISPTINQWPQFSETIYNWIHASSVFTFIWDDISMG